MYMYVCKNKELLIDFECCMYGYQYYDVLVISVTFPHLVI